MTLPDTSAGSQRNLSGHRRTSRTGLISVVLRRGFGSFAGYGYLLLIYLFILVPLGVVIVGSVNSATSFPSSFESFTMDWYREVFHRPEFVRSIALSAQVALASASLATLLGFPLAVLITRSGYRSMNALHNFFLTPLMIPQVAAGVALLQLFTMLGIPRGGVGLILAHTIFVMPFVFRSTIASLQQIDPAVEEAAMVLGARRSQALRLVTLPLVRAGVTAGFLLSFIVSIINVPVSLFLTAPGAETLPIRVLAYMESRLDPLIGALGALMIVGSVVIFVFIEKVLKVQILR